MGTKQLKLDETVFGSPFFIHTRNCARCSPSLSQEVGLRIRSLHGAMPARFHCERCLLECVRAVLKYGCLIWRDAIGIPSASQDCRAFSKQNFGSRTIQLPDLRNIVHISARSARRFWYRGGNMAERNYSPLSSAELPEPPDGSFKLIDSIWQMLWNQKCIRKRRQLQLQPSPGRAKIQTDG